MLSIEPDGALNIRTSAVPKVVKLPPVRATIDIGVDANEAARMLRKIADRLEIIGEQEMA